MTTRLRLITRIALLAAMIYVLSWATSYFPNVNLAFFIAFSAGYIWGAWPGIAIGALGMWLWTSFNPIGPAMPIVAVAQVAGLGLCGLLGFLFRTLLSNVEVGRIRTSLLLLAALLCTLVFYVPVSVADAWVIQPFWPRLWGGLVFSLISLVANLLIFPLLFSVTRRISEREGAV
jgi:hypothetical protein